MRIIDTFVSCVIDIVQIFLQCFTFDKTFFLQADSNLIATLDWEIPSTTFISIIESNEGRGEVEIKGCLRYKEFIWFVE